MAVIGAYMVIAAAFKSERIPYRWLHARAQVLWKDKAHAFLLVSGLLVAGFGVVLAFR